MSEPRYNCGKCAICNPKVYAFHFGAVQKERRRSHEEVVLDRRKRKEAIANRKELHAKLRLEREARRKAKEVKPCTQTKSMS